MTITCQYCQLPMVEGMHCYHCGLRPGELAERQARPIPQVSNIPAAIGGLCGFFLVAAMIYSAAFGAPETPKAKPSPSAAALEIGRKIGGKIQTSKAGGRIVGIRAFADRTGAVKDFSVAAEPYMRSLANSADPMTTMIAGLLDHKVMWVDPGSLIQIVGRDRRLPNMFTVRVLRQETIVNKGADRAYLWWIDANQLVEAASED